MVTKRMTGAVLVASVLSSNLASQARAAEITDKAPCSEMVAASDANNPVRFRPFILYIMNSMEVMDSRHTEAGEPGIMAQLSDEGRLNMAAAASVRCRNYPKMTIYNATAAVYRGIRDMQIQFGAAK